MHKDSNATRKRTWDRHFMAAQQRYFQPTKLACRKRRELGIQVGGRCEDRAGHILRVDPVSADHERHELPSRRENRLARVIANRGCPANSSTQHDLRNSDESLHGPMKAWTPPSPDYTRISQSADCAFIATSLFFRAESSITWKLNRAAGALRLITRDRRKILANCHVQGDWGGADLGRDIRKPFWSR